MSHPIVFPGARSPAQAKAGNYKKRRVQWQGLTISIENEAGTIRRGRSRDGKEWEQRMVFPYGEIMRTTGVDGDPVDVFLGPNMDAPMVYVVHQKTYGDWDRYDEDKCGVGFLSEDEAAAAFLANYNDPRFLGTITTMPVSAFVEKAKSTKEAPAMIKCFMIFKSRVDSYTRHGKMVTGYDNHKSGTAADADGTKSMTTESKTVATIGKYRILLSPTRQKRGIAPYAVFKDGEVRGLHQCHTEKEARDFVAARND